MLKGVSFQNVPYAFRPIRNLCFKEIPLVPIRVASQESTANKVDVSYNYENGC